MAGQSAQADIIDAIAGPEDTDEDVAAMEKDLAAEAEAEAVAEAKPEADKARPAEGDDTVAAGEAEAETEAEGAGEAGGEAKPDKPEEKTVPLAALHEARDETKSLRAERDEMLAKMARMEALFEEAQKKPAKAGDEAEEEDEPIPSYDEDPDAHFQGTIKALEKKIANMEAETGRRREVEEATATEQQLLERYAGHVREFTEKTPDFQDAYSFLADSVDTELKARGLTDDKQRSEAMQFEEGKLVGMAMLQGKDPAEALYNLAKLRGYAPKDGEGEGEGEGESDEDKLERLQKGQAAATSLSGRGSTGAAPTSLEALAEMEEGPEFDAAWEKCRRAGLLG